MANACGLDFGTSNSTVGLIRTGEPTLLQLEGDQVTLPSVVFFNAEDEQISYGRAALATYLDGAEGRLMRSLKSLLGTPLIDGHTEVMGKTLPFKHLLGLYIGELKHRAEIASATKFTRAVFGRPVFFVDGDAAADCSAQQTLEAIAHDVGFDEVVFQLEPIAAALDYESHITHEELVLIVDIGGGTSDFSVVRLGPQRRNLIDRQSDILANGGVHIGGTDFDKYISLATVMPLLGLGSQMKNGAEIPSAPYFKLATWHTINQLYTPKMWSQLNDMRHDLAQRDGLERLLDLIKRRSGHWLAMQIELGKVALSSEAAVTLTLDRIASLQEVTFTRSAFRAAVVHLHDAISDTVVKTLNDAGINANAIETVFFTGGTSAVSGLRETISSMVPNARSVVGDLFGSIGTGLALHADRCFK